MTDLRRQFALATLLRVDSDPALIIGTEHLHIGSVGSVLNKSSLRRAGISHTLCVGEGVESPSEEVTSELGLTHRHFGVLDKPDVDIQIIFQSCFDYIENARKECGQVLVYCFQGKSRSVTVVAAYLMKYYTMSFVDALAAIRETRPAASPNLGFIVALRKYEKVLNAGNEPATQLEENNSDTVY